MDKVLFEKEVKRAWITSQKEVGVDKDRVHFSTFVKICEDIMEEDIPLSKVYGGASRIYEVLSQVNIIEDFGQAKCSARNTHYYEDLPNEYFVYTDGNGKKRKLFALSFVRQVYEGKTNPYHIKSNIVGTYSQFFSNTYANKKGVVNND